MTFLDFGIHVGNASGIEVATTCPQCSPKRKNSKGKCLSVNTEKGVWFCHHCGWKGSLKEGAEKPTRKIYSRPVWNPARPVAETLQEQMFSFFFRRGIPPAIVEQEGIRVEDMWIAQLDDRVPCIAFPYRKAGEVVNAKYRALTEKAFAQSPGAEKVLYRQDAIEKSYCIVVEGELDALALVSAGLSSVVSVPDGAPDPNSKNYTAKFNYLDQQPDPFEGVERVYLAVDSDAPGQTLERELARRIGTDRCWLVRWERNRKDANEVLIQDGPEELLAAIQRAQPFPVQDVVRVLDTADSIMTRYYNAPTRGLSTGWANIDRLYTIEAGQMTVVTGMPSSGKSEWLDALAMNLATLHGWRFAICSPENSPVEMHIEKFLEKRIGRPFRPGASERMDPMDIPPALEYLNEQILFVMPEEALTISGLLDRATTLVRRFGIRGLIIDPFNEFDHTRAAGVSETEYISLTLGLLKRWARRWQVHVWLVAHPTKIYRREDGSYPVPGPYDISGSAHFRNKADNCLSVWRDLDADQVNNTALVQIHVQKIRFKHIGAIGAAELEWDRRNGRYRDVASMPEAKEV